MSDNTQIETLLTNIQQGLKKYSVAELNVALVKALNNKHDKADIIEYVIKIVCKEFDITEYTLKHMTVRGNMQDAKHISFCLLYFDVGLTIRFIADNVFFNWSTSVANGIKRFKKCDIELKQDKEFLDRYNLLKTKLTIFLKKKNKS